MSSAALAQQIVAETARLLGAIRTADGFHTDAGLNVLTEENHTLALEDVVSLELVGMTSNVEHDGPKRRTGLLSIAVEINLPLTAVSAAAYALALRAIEDVQKAVGRRDQHRYPVQVQAVLIGNWQIEEREPGARIFRPQQTLQFRCLEVL